MRMIGRLRVFTAQNIKIVGSYFGSHMFLHFTSYWTVSLKISVCRIPSHRTPSYGTITNTAAYPKKILKVIVDPLWLACLLLLEVIPQEFQKS